MSDGMTPADIARLDPQAPVTRERLFDSEVRLVEPRFDSYRAPVYIFKGATFLDKRDPYSDDDTYDRV